MQFGGMARWANRNALVTGCSSGIGATITKDLLRYGVNVIGCARNVDKINVSILYSILKAFQSVTFFWFSVIKFICFPHFYVWSCMYVTVPLPLVCSFGNMLTCHLVAPVFIEFVCAV